jgi:hypothetical protein
MSKKQKFIVVSPAGAKQVTEAEFEQHHTEQEQYAEQERILMGRTSMWIRALLGRRMDEGRKIAGRLHSLDDDRSLGSRVRAYKTGYLVEFLWEQPEHHRLAFLRTADLDDQPTSPHNELLLAYLSSGFFDENVSADDYDKWLRSQAPLV